MEARTTATGDGDLRMTPGTIPAIASSASDTLQANTRYLYQQTMATGSVMQPNHSPSQNP
jgi:hypothetical protein